MHTRTRASVGTAAAEPLTDLRLTAHEVSMLRGMMLEQVDNDMDMLDDLEHADELAGMAADDTIARIAFAVRLEVRLSASLD